MRAVSLLLLCPNEPPLYILPLSPLFPSAPYYRMSASSVSQFKLYQTNLHAHKTMRNKIVPFSFQHYTNVTRILCRRSVYHNLPELHFDPFGLSLSLVCLLRAQGGRLVTSAAAFRSSTSGAGTIRCPPEIAPRW